MHVRMPIETENPDHYQRLAGVDEVGRGSLAGPVIAAAVILHKDSALDGLADSKKLSSNQRQRLAASIKKQANAWAIGRAEADEIDEINILQASLLAMQRAVNGLDIIPDAVMVDGLHKPVVEPICYAIVKGDSLIPAISAASIVAKVYRDNEMMRLDADYPGYGFARHKGYPTREHLAALDELGVSALHRRSFGPVKKRLAD